MKNHNKSTKRFKKLLLCCFTALLILIGLLPVSGNTNPGTPDSSSQIELCNENPCESNIGRD